jgi:hypothetical protein
MEPNTSHAKLRYVNLLHTSIRLYNEMTTQLREGYVWGFDVVDFVLSDSDFIEETALMREQMDWDIRSCKHDLVLYYHHTKIPYPVETFKAFNKKANKVKDYAIDIVTKMYRLDQINRKEVAEELRRGS